MHNLVINTKINQNVQKNLIRFPLWHLLSVTIGYGTSNLSLFTNTVSPWLQFCKLAIAILPQFENSVREIDCQWDLR